MIAAGSGASDDGDRQTQLLRGALDMCLLALLARRATHGYELVGRLEAIGIEGVGYGTIYPLLTRMRRLGLVVDEVQASPTGPPRKVYAVTDAGQERLDAWRRQWTRFVHTVNTALTDSTSDNARS
ncbi:PadR family transcriptional regulator [Micromonospora sp. AMSO12t]|uniref:PadR family transcriptional regulator n=1 Tax=unclassified Micromonospora TaxID=2617518 RepID=UPI00124B45F2|nr:PadR family transcriptional regulator [Micromonospora sp. AMSO12t]KAB1155660.1 PadR family transcriptional regulator [Micromonospora sp. AMSO12t]